MDPNVPARYPSGGRPGIQVMCMKHATMDQLHGLDDVSGKGCAAHMPPPSTPFLDSHTPQPLEASLSTELCRSKLGDRTFHVLRHAMLQQQELFIEQLWELHRLTRTQGRRAVLLQSEPRLLNEQVDVVRDVLSRQRQELIRSQTLQEISQLPTIPSSLRRSFTATNSVYEGQQEQKACQVSSAASPASMASGTIRASMPARDPAHPSGPSGVASPQRMPGTYAGPMFPAALNRRLAYPQGHLSGPAQAGFAFADSTGGQYAWPPGNPHLAGAAFPQSALPGMHGQHALSAAPNGPYLTGMPTWSRTYAAPFSGVPPIAAPPPAVCACGSALACAEQLAERPPFSAGLQQHGSLSIGVCNTGYASMTQLHTPQHSDKQPSQPSGMSGAATQEKPQPHAPPSAPVDVSSLLGMMAPGLQGMPPDMHSQWFAKNFSGAGVPLNAPMSQPLLSLQGSVEAAMPEHKVCTTSWLSSCDCVGSSWQPWG
jgi:hypothetical protein